MFFFCISLCKTCDPRAVPILNQVTFNKLGRGLLDVIHVHIKYQSSLHVVVQISDNVKIVAP